MDLPHGRIDSGGPEAERVVALPATWFGEALEGLTDGRDAFADRLVGAIVREAAAALDDAAASAPDEVRRGRSRSPSRAGGSASRSWNVAATRCSSCGARRP